MINSVNLTGRLTRDIELRYTQGGTAVANFTLAVNRTFKKEGRPDADFISCVAWAKTAEVLSQYTKRGDLIGVTGRLETRNYEDKDGKTVYITETVIEKLVFLQSKDDKQAKQQNNGQNNGSPFTETETIDEHALPF